MSIPSWRRSFAQAAKEFQLSKLKVIEGSIPKSLKGSLYRNGPGRLERGGQSMGHYFDGDGAILGVHFNDGQAKGTYKYVQTEGYRNEEAQNKLLYANFGLANQGPFWKKFSGSKVKNAANTSVLPLPDKLLALWEGGWPHALDLETLETIGMDNLGFLEKGKTYSAHPKVDYETGEIYNIGTLHGKDSYLLLYKCDKTGKKILETRLKHRINMVHDFQLAGKYAVVMSFPTEVKNPFPLLFGYKSFNDVLKWKPSLGTEIFVFDRNDLSLVAQLHTGPFYSYHYTNGYVDKDDSIYVEFVKHENYEKFNEWLTGVADQSKPLLADPLSGRLASIRIDPVKKTVTEVKEVTGESAEFPTVADANVGNRWRYSLFASGTDKYKNPELQLNAIGRYDYETQTCKLFDYGVHKYVTEPILASSEHDPELGHILVPVYDAQAHKSELWIHDSQNIEKEPVCIIDLPEVIPPGFHGRWKSC